jgi:hypothetical protein
VYLLCCILGNSARCCNDDLAKINDTGKFTLNLKSDQEARISAALSVNAANDASSIVENFNSSRNGTNKELYPCSAFNCQHNDDGQSHWSMNGCTEVEEALDCVLSPVWSIPYVKSSCKRLNYLMPCYTIKMLEVCRHSTS